jgi:plasminogen activator
MRKTPFIFTIVSLALASPISALASSLDKMAYQFDGLSLNAGLGYLSGESHEYVYTENMDRKISQLNWKINNALITKAEINYDLLSWLSLNGRGWTTLSKSKGLLDDYDWLNNNQSHWTDWSHHENTHLDYGGGIDLNLQTWLLYNQNYKLGFLGGYERNSFSFMAKGGCFQYDNGSYLGCFADDEPGIRYRQTFSSPYVGLAGKYAVNNIELSLLFKFSNWVKANDNDEHYARNLTFKEWGDSSKFHSLTLNAGYYFTKNTKIFTEVSYTRYSNAKANTEIIDNDSGERLYIPNSAGLDNKNYALMLGLKYIFN